MQRNLPSTPLEPTTHKDFALNDDQRYGLEDTRMAYFIRDEYVRFAGDCYHIKTGIKTEQPFLACSTTGKYRSCPNKQLYQVKQPYNQEYLPYVWYSNKVEHQAFLNDRVTNNRIYSWNSLTSSFDPLPYLINGRREVVDTQIGVVLYLTPHPNQTLIIVKPDEKAVYTCDSSVLSQPADVICISPNLEKVLVALHNAKSDKPNLFVRSTKTGDARQIDQSFQAIIGRFSNDSIMVACGSGFHRTDGKSVLVIDSNTGQTTHTFTFPDELKTPTDPSPYPLDMLFVKEDRYLWVLFSNRYVVSYSLHVTPGETPWRSVFLDPNSSEKDLPQDGEEFIERSEVISPASPSPPLSPLSDIPSHVVDFVKTKPS